MGKSLEYKNIFTQYDESLERTLKLDPMGLSIIWTHFGQRVFKGKISSATWDVRSFNINLFNHFVIKKLMNEGTDEIKNLFEKDKKETIEKLIIILENMIVWSWYQDKEEWDRKNLLGTSKAISLWTNDTPIKIDINDNIDNLELLIRQKTTGVNGSYKGSFISMGFFDSNYYDYFDDTDTFDKVSELILGHEKLKDLYEKVIKFFNTMNVNDIPIEAYKNIFSKTSILSQHSKDFWEENLGFSEGEAKEIYDEIGDEISTQDCFKSLSSDEQNTEIRRIVELEPKLSYLDAIFNYLLFCDGQNIKELEKKKFFDELKNLDFLDEESISEDGTKERLNALQKVVDIESLIIFHKKDVMEAREYAPWLKIENDTLIVDVKSKEEKSYIEDKLKVVKEYGLKNIPWLHSYYAGSIRSIKKGFNDDTL